MLLRCIAASTRAFSGSAASSAVKVTVLGANGGIGQPLSLLLKTNERVGSLALYDLAHTPGVAADLSHINSAAKVTGHKGADELPAALKGSDVVVIPAGVPRKPGMTRDDLFNTNASIVATLTHAIANTVPIAAEVLKRAGVYNPKRLYGVTTLDVVRANTFIAEACGWSARATDVTVIGGHAGITILPLLSQIAGAKLTPEQIAALTNRIQFGGDEVVKAKDGAGSATLSMAFAADRFVASLLRALAGEKGVSECAFVESTVVPGAPFFSTRVELGVDGVAAVHGTGNLSAFEQAALDKMLPELKGSIEKGVKFAASWAPK